MQNNLLAYLKLDHILDSDENEFSREIKRVRRILKQTFDLSNPELLDQLEVELALLGIDYDYTNSSLCSFTTEEKHLGCLSTNLDDQKVRWLNEDYEEEEEFLYSITEVVNKIRKELLNI